MLICVFAGCTGHFVGFVMRRLIYEICSQVINQTVLSNRRAYGDLYVRLMSTDIEREKTQHTWWKRRADDWKMLKTELAIKRFK